MQLLRHTSTAAPQPIKVLQHAPPTHLTAHESRGVTRLNWERAVKGFQKCGPTRTHCKSSWLPYLTRLKGHRHNLLWGCAAGSSLNCSTSCWPPQTMCPCTHNEGEFPSTAELKFHRLLLCNLQLVYCTACMLQLWLAPHQSNYCELGVCSAHATCTHPSQLQLCCYPFKFPAPTTMW